MSFAITLFMEIFFNSSPSSGSHPHSLYGHCTLRHGIAVVASTFRPNPVVIRFCTIDGIRLSRLSLTLSFFSRRKFFQSLHIMLTNDLRFNAKWRTWNLYGKYKSKCANRKLSKRCLVYPFLHR